jgi:hypothetical protein
MSREIISDAFSNTNRRSRHVIEHIYISWIIFVLHSTAFQYKQYEEVYYQMSKFNIHGSGYQRPGNQFEQPWIVLL